ncbi:MAG: DUF1294 domain-containing protein [Planctomycetota bacterium]
MPRPFLLILAVYAVMSVVSFIAYGWDKRAAIKGHRRTREKTLHLIDLAFGWPGGLAAQRLIRHKTRDTKFQIWFWLTVFAHPAAIAVWVWWSTRS